MDDVKFWRIIRLEILIEIKLPRMKTPIVTILMQVRAYKEEGS